uniref:CMRF35-like molecule 1 n=1 Tax=Cyprinus carpio TaxID=7962 RepID=A0A8C2FBE9_CYPCA
MIFLFSVVVGAPVTVTGHRGESLNIRCTYESGYESNSKYLCKGACKIGNKVILVKSGSPAEDQRFSLSDARTARVFTVTITELRQEDAGQYWCGVERTLIDVYSEILVLVKLENKTTEVSTISTFSTTPSYFSTTEPYPQSSSITITERKETIPDQQNSSAGSVIYISVGVVIMLVIFLMALMLLCMKRSRKSPRVTQSGLSQQVSVVLLPLNEKTAEDFNDHKYEEINKWQHKNKDITTVYTTADRLDDPTIYSTADKPDDPTIYSTADKPDDSTIYSSADKPEDSTIYSTADKPDDSMIYSTADKPDVSTIYSTVD